jgi:hypothetical protein
MSFKMEIIEERIHFTSDDGSQEPDISSETVFGVNEFDSIEDMAACIKCYLGHCELDCLTPDRNSWLTSVEPETDYSTGEDTYYQAFPKLTVPQWEQLLAILVTWGLTNWTPLLVKPVGGYVDSKGNLYVF